MKSQPFLFLLSTCIPITEAFALQELPWVDHQETRLEISNLEATRLAIKDDRISNVLGSPTLEIDSDNETGQIFIKPKADYKKADKIPISLTLITESGETQDLKLHPIDKDSESILFVKNPLKMKDSSRALHEDHASSELTKNVLHLIREVAQGSIPTGFKEHGKVLQRNLPNDFESTLTLIPLTRFVSEEQDLEIHLYHVHPKDLAGSLVLEEKDFAQPGDIALSFEHLSISKGHTTRLLIIRWGGPEHV